MSKKSTVVLAILVMAFVGLVGAAFAAPEQTVNVVVEFDGNTHQLTEPGCVSSDGQPKTFNISVYAGAFATNGREDSTGWENRVGAQQGVCQLNGWYGWHVCVGMDDTEALAELVAIDPGAAGNPTVYIDPVGPLPTSTPTSTATNTPEPPTATATSTTPPPTVYVLNISVTI